MKFDKKLIITIVATLVIAGGGGFFAGTKYQQSQASGSMPTDRQMAGQNGGFPGGSDTSSSPVSGEIISVDEDSVTVKSADGSNTIVIIAGSTVINKAETGTMEDLTEGETITVMGTESSEGTLTATSIQLGGQEMVKGVFNSRR